MFSHSVEKNQFVFKDHWTRTVKIGTGGGHFLLLLGTSSVKSFERPRFEQHFSKIRLHILKRPQNFKKMIPFVMALLSKAQILWEGLKIWKKSTVCYLALLSNVKKSDQSKQFAQMYVFKLEQIKTAFVSTV